MIAGELESATDYQLYNLARANHLADLEKFQRGQPRAEPTKEARTERNLQGFYHNFGHLLSKSLKSFED